MQIFCVKCQLHPTVFTNTMFQECGLINFKIILLMYPQRDKPGSRNPITRNYVNSMCEM